MYKLISALLFIGSLSVIKAEDYRKWTEAESKRQIEAKIIDKKFDDSEAKLLLKNGKAIWMTAERLSPVDNEYIKNWIKSVDHISARVVRSEKGKKKVEVTAIAGAKPMTVKAYWRDEGRQPTGYPKVFQLKAGEEKTFTYQASNEYTVKAWSGEDLVDEESWDSKTGL